MYMPEMDGIGFARRVRALDKMRPFPMVLLAPASTLANRGEELGALFAGWGMKPIKRAQLLKLMTSALGGGHPPLRAPKARVLDPGLAERLPMRILLADDNAVNQALTLAILGRMGYKADLAADGQEVLDALECHQYDLIFMDVQMPVMDGLEATRRIIRLLPPEQRPRIVAITANAMHGDRERCLAAGMDDYLSKPVSLEDLRMMVEKYAPVPVERGLG
jgi:CheY-like chemotaxis protein